jgi:cell wall assembly regulator SMI1
MNAFKQLVDFLQVYAKSPILNPPASPGDLSEVEDIVGHKLPEDVLAAYLLGNGEAELAERTEYDRDPGIFAGKSFYPTQVIIEEYRLKKELLDSVYGDRKEDDVLVYPPDTVKNYFFRTGWIPIGGISPDTIAVDLDPGPKGVEGQIILVGIDDNKYFQVGASFSDFCLFLLDQYKKQKMHRWVLRDDDPDKEGELLFKAVGFHSHEHDGLLPSPFGDFNQGVSSVQVPCKEGKVFFGVNSDYQASLRNFLN